MKKQILVLAVFALIFCGVGYVGATPFFYGDNGHWYELITIDKITWAQANANANDLSYNDLDGHLATITSSGENIFIKGLFSSTVDVVWLGGFQDATATEPDGDWQWVTGESWGYTNWTGDEPNDYQGDEDALTMRGQGNWNDAPTLYADYNNSGYVVEYESAPVPEPATMLLFGTGIAGLVCSRFRKKKK